MPIDRAATLRNAEKYLKQGKLDSAIAEYVRVIEDQPRDWTTANTLGDLYVRAGQIDKAIEQFTRIADNLASDGFLPKAAALYKKILKLKPDHEPALVEAAEIAARQGLFVDARSYLKTIAERRRARGDERGVAEVEIRLGGLDPADYPARMAAAQARVRIGEGDVALAELKAIAAELNEKERGAEAIEALRAAADLAPGDAEIQALLLRTYIAAGDLAEARAWARTPDDYRTIAAALAERGEADAAVAVLRHAVSRYPDDGGLRGAMVRALLAAGDVDQASAYFDGDPDPTLSLRIAVAHLAGGRAEQGQALLRRLLQEDPLQRDPVALLAWDFAERAPDTTYAVIDLAARMSAEQGDYNWAALALQEFVRRTPGHIPALLRLVEICVDGGLDRTTPVAQAELADAYLAAGAAAEARVVAEDLAIRNPSNPAHVDRLRRALEMAGEPDPDAVMAELLTASSSLDDLDLGAETPPAGTEPAGTVEPAREPDTSPEHAPGLAPASGPTPAGTPGPAAREEVHDPEPVTIASREDESDEDLPQFELSGAGVDIDALLRELEGPVPPPRPAPANLEVDLSVVLDTIKPGTPPLPRPASPPVPAAAAPAADLDEVFGQLRQEAAARRPSDRAEAEFARARTLFDAGDADGALDALNVAAGSPSVRFGAASFAARICRARGRTALAIEWLEKAADAPAPAAEQAHAILYELAELLEAEGETARALAVCLELQAEAGDYRDVSVRVDRLTRAAARG